MQIEKLPGNAAEPRISRPKTTSPTSSPAPPPGGVMLGSRPINLTTVLLRYPLDCSNLAVATASRHVPRIATSKMLERLYCDVTVHMRKA
ncbi:AMPK1_CBM domain-containing protein [Psidium guajava]|nr:AMPK1_CBM domain-containing protein [Psidium guajava]